MTMMRPTRIVPRVRLNNVTPFTYRDGYTFLELIEELREWATEVFPKEIEGIIDVLVDELEKASEQYEAGVDEFQRIHDAFMADVNAALMALNDTAVTQLVNDDESALGGALRAIFATKDELGHTSTTYVRTVGVGGDFETINEGLHELSKLKKLHVPGIQVELKLLAGFVVAEQVVVEQEDLGWITITSEDPIVYIRRGAITALHPRAGRAVFTGYNNATLPMFSVLFEFDQTGENLEQTGCVVVHNSSVTFDLDCGIMGAPKRGINVQQGSNASLTRTVWNRCGEGGIRVANGSFCNAEGATATDCSAFGASISSASVFMANRSTFTGNGDRGVSVANGSTASVVESDVSDCPMGLYAYDNGIIDGMNVTANNCSNYGVYARRGGTVNAENISLVDTRIGIYAADSGKVHAKNATGENNNDFVTAIGGAEVNVSGSTATGTVNFVISASHSNVVATSMVGTNSQNRGISSFASNVSAVGIDVSGAVSAGVYAQRGSYVNISDGNVQRGAEPASGDIVCITGSTVAATGATGGYGGTANTPSASGIVYTEQT